MIAVILAGGFGTRLQPLTFVRPKHMLPIVDKPMLEHVVEYTIKNGFKEVIISIGSEKDFGTIREYFSKKKFNAKIIFISEPQRLGGVGAIKYIIEKRNIKETFALVLGDNLTDINLKKMFKFHKKNPAIATIALMQSETPWNFGVAKLKGSKIVGFVEKPEKGKEPSKWISTGLYIIEPDIVKFIPKDFLDSTGMLFPILLKKGEKINGYKSKGAFWIDVGRPESYLEATCQVLKQYKKKTWIDKGVKIGKKTKLEGAVVIHKNTEVGSGCNIKNSIIFEGCIIGNRCKIKNAIIDENCKIISGSKVSGVLGKGTVI